MRTVQAEKARYQWLTPKQWGEQTGCSASHIRALIKSGWFRHDGEQPECVDVSLPGARHPTYFLSPESLKRWFAERAQKGAA